MSSILNPFAFTPLGQPAAPTVSALRCIGGAATAEQLSAAQAAFQSFCTQARLSPAPNPTSIGQLPDGSQYKIAVVGAMATMTLWPRGGNDTVRSGIAIAFGDLDGNPISGFEVDGESTTYLLTPRVVSGTRDSTGEWRVQKLNSPKQGGKAVNSDSTGKIYFTGVQGLDELQYPEKFGSYGSVNERAYSVEDGSALAVFRNGAQVAVSASPFAPIPFILEWEQGGKYAAQLVTRTINRGANTAVDLLVGPISTTPGEAVGDVVGTVVLPPDTRLQWWRLSFGLGGREARALSFSAGTVCKLTFNITPVSLSYTTNECKLTGAKSTSDYATPTGGATNNIETSGGASTGSIISTHTYSSNGNYTDVDGVIKPIMGTGGTGVIKLESANSFVWAFGPKGQQIDRETSGQSTVTTTSYQTDSEGTDSNFWFPGGTYSTGSFGKTESRSRLTKVTTIDSELANFIGADASGIVTHDETFSSNVGSSSSSENDGPTTTNFFGGGTGRRITRGPGLIKPIFFDRYVGFAIYIDSSSEATTETWATKYENYIETIVYSNISVSPPQAALIVKHKTGVIMRMALNPENLGDFVAYSAADPMTGAIVVNLQKIERLPSGQIRRLASWIYLVDDNGAKTIQNVMPGLPQNTCVKENRLLYSL